jgi:hypothetical protein
MSHQNRKFGRYAFAHRLGVSPDVIPRFVARGVLPRPDGRRGQPPVEYWLHETILSWEQSGCPRLNPCLEKIG